MAGSGSLNFQGHRPLFGGAQFHVLQTTLCKAMLIFSESEFDIVQLRVEAIFSDVNSVNCEIITCPTM